jgi:hypothetical protein
VDTGERELMRLSARNLLKTADPEEILDALLELGWLDYLDTDPGDAVMVMAEEQGRLLAATPILDLVMQDAAQLSIEPGRALLLPAIARTVDRSGTWTSGGLHIDGLALRGRKAADTLLVLTAQGMVTAPAASLARVPVSGADATFGLTRIRGCVAPSGVQLVAPPSAVDAAVSAGRRWLASELIGLAEAMLAETIAHVSTRHQFGHPIASFQTVKHRLADVHVAVVAAKAGISTAWSDETPRSATAAKCLAALAHDLASTHSHQVHGGIAFTVEYGFHRWIERGRLLDAVLGSRVELTRNLGQALIADGAVPRTPGLVDLSA